MPAEDRELEFELEKERIKKNLEKINYKIMVFSGKGGVGKTTVSVNIACGFHQKGYRVGILDADVTGPNIPKILGISERVNIEGQRIIPYNYEGVKVISLGSMIESDEPVIWRGPRRSKLLNQFVADVEWGDLDLLVVDLPPGTGDEIITIGQTIKPDLALIVTTPQELSLTDSKRAVNMAKKLNISETALIENMAGFKCPSCNSIVNIFGFGGGEAQAIEMGIKFLGRLPLSLEFRFGLEWSKLICNYNKNDNVYNEIMNIVKKLEKMAFRKRTKGERVRIT